MNEKNMNPEQIRLHQLHLKSERMRQEAHSASAYGGTGHSTKVSAPKTDRKETHLRTQSGSQEPAKRKSSHTVKVVGNDGRFTPEMEKILRSYPEPVRRWFESFYGYRAADGSIHMRDQIVYR